MFDFTHAHLHKCMYFFLGASKFFHPTCICACRFPITCFTVLVDVHNTLIKLIVTFSFHISHHFGDTDESAQPQHDENVESGSCSACDEALPKTCCCCCSIMCT